MNLEFRHDVKGLWGYHEVQDRTYCFDDDVLSLAFREFRKDKDSVLWAQDLSVDADHKNIVHLSMCWETWEDYDNKIVTMTIWREYNDREYRKYPWERSKRLFKAAVEKAKRGDVMVTDVFKPLKVYNK